MGLRIQWPQILLFSFVVYEFGWQDWTCTASCFAQVLLQGGKELPVTLHSDLQVLDSGDLQQFMEQGVTNPNCLSPVNQRMGPLRNEEERVMILLHVTVPRETLPPQASSSYNQCFPILAVLSEPPRELQKNTDAWALCRENMI